MDNTSLVYFEIYFTRLDVFHCLGHVHRYRTALGVRHQSARAENTAYATYLTHYRRHGDDNVDVGPTTLDLLDVLVKTNIVGASLFGSSFCIGRTKNKNAHGLTSSVGQRTNAANHLVGLAGVYAQTHVDVERSVKLSSGDFLHQLSSLFQCIGFPCFNLISY